MEVERLIVLVLSAETQRNEIQEADKRDGYALAVKFLNKRKAEIAKGWQEVANGAGFDVAGHGAAQIGKHAAMVVHCRDGKLLTELDVITAFLRDAKTCGIYILMHGIHGMAIPNEASATFLSPEYVAKLAGTMCPKKTISLLKVNIVGCTLAMKPEAGQGDKKLRKVRKAISKAGSWAQAFCKALERRETMVAAYTDAVYVVRDENPEFKTFGVDGSQRPEGSKLGQKAVGIQTGTDKKIEMVAAHRTTVKRVFQYDGVDDKVVNVPPDKYKAWGS